MATVGQLEFIQKLCTERGQEYKEADYKNLDNTAASTAISKLMLLPKVKGSQAIKTVVTEHSGFNGMRFGMCIKLVADKWDMLPGTEEQINNFDAEVTRFYHIVTDIETGLNNSVSA